MSIAITNVQTLGDGFGEHYRNIILLMSLAEFKGLKFVYSPFQNLVHSNDDLVFDEKMDTMINLKKYLEINDENTNQKYTIASIRKMDLYHFYDNNILIFEKSNTLKLIRTAFKEKNANPWENKCINANSKNIAIHIRRPDSYDLQPLLLNNYIKRLHVSVELYTSIIGQLLDTYPNSKIHIYSQLTDNQSEFDAYKSIDDNRIILHLDEPLEKTFVEMVFADILVTAPSALSYTAGLLSDNMIYYLSYSSPPLSHWNIIEGYDGDNLHYFTIDMPGAWVSYNSKIDKMNVENIAKFRC